MFVLLHSNTMILPVCDIDFFSTLWYNKYDNESFSDADAQ